MTAAVVSAAGQQAARYFALCEHCGWAGPVSGLVTEPTARAYADEPNENHGDD